MHDHRKPADPHEEAVVDETDGEQSAERHVEEPDPSIGESAKENPAEGYDPEQPHGV